MATSERPRAASRSATPQNSATMGVVLVAVALVVGLFLLLKGGTSTESATDEGPSGSGSGADTEQTTTTAPPTTTPPAQLEVIVANGSGVGGRAKATSEVLKAVGYTAISAVDGTATETTTIYYIAGFETDAAGIAQAMGLGLDRMAAMPPQPPLKSGELGTAKALVLVGPDWDPANPPAPTAG